MIVYYSLPGGCSSDAFSLVGCSSVGCSSDAFSLVGCSIADFSSFLLHPTKFTETNAEIATRISNFFIMFIDINFLSLLSILVLIVLIQYHTVQSHQYIF